LGGGRRRGRARRRTPAAIAAADHDARVARAVGAVPADREHPRDRVRVLWGLYQSIVNIGGTWYGFGWETLLLEAGFLAVFLGNDALAPPWPVILAFRWLGVRGVIWGGLIHTARD